MLGATLILLCASLWATDAIFRLPLATSLSTGTIIVAEHLICVAATLPLFFTRRRELRSLGSRGWLSGAFIGLMGSAVGTYCFTASYRHINPSVAILLQKTQPIVAILAARVVLGERPRVGFYAWTAVALFASAMVSFPRGLAAAELADMGRLKGLGLATGAAACWGLSTVFGKWITSRLTFGVTSFLRFAFGLAGALCLAAAGLWELQSPLALDANAAASLAYMGLVPGVLAMYLYYAGLKLTRASVAAIAEMFFPVAAVALNWLVLGQRLEAVQLAGMALLLMSVFFINKGLR